MWLLWALRSAALPRPEARRRRAPWAPAVLLILGFLAPAGGAETGSGGSPPASSPTATPTAPDTLESLLADLLTVEDVERREAAFQTARSLPPEALEQVIAALGETLTEDDTQTPSGPLAAFAALALSEIGDPAVPVLRAALLHPQERVRAAAAAHIGRAGPRAAEALPELIRLLEDPEYTVQIRAAWALRALGPDAAPAVPAVVAHLRRHPKEKSFIDALAAIGPQAAPAVPILTAILQGRTEGSSARSALYARCAAVDALGAIGPQASSAAGPLTERPPEQLCYLEKVAQALAALGPGALPELSSTLGTEEPSRRKLAAAALAQMVQDSPQALPALLQALDDGEAEIRAIALEGLIRLPTLPPAAVAAAAAATRDPSPFVAARAAAALQGRPGGPAEQALAAYRIRRAAAEDRQAASKDSPWQLEQIRAPLPPTPDRLRPLALTQELALPDEAAPGLLVTVHGGTDGQRARLALWRRRESGFELLESQEHSGVQASALHVGAHLLLHLLFWEPAAGHVWTTETLTYLAPDLSLHPIGLRPPGRCAEGPSLGEGTQLGGYGIVLTLEDDRMTFEAPIWKPGDPQHFPSGGTVAGTFELQGSPGLDPATGRYHPTFELVTATCEVSREDR